MAFADRGLRVLAVSTDQAHSLGDVFGGQVPDGVQVRHIDARELVRRRWRALLDLAPAVDRGDAPDLFALEPEELTAVPGVEELLTLVEVERLRGSGEWDAVVVDCAPTAESLRLLTLPSAVLAYLERVWPRHRRLTAAVGARAVVVVGMVEGLAQALAQLRGTLADPGVTAVRLVLSPERVVLAEAKRTVGALAVLGVRPRAVIANRVLVPYDRADAAPARAGGPVSASPAEVWYQDRVAQQRSVLAELEGVLGGVPVRQVGYMAAEPVGAAALAGLAAAVFGDGAEVVPVEGAWARGRVELESGSGLDSVYLFRLSLPLVDPQSLSLGRVEDDLLVGAAGVSARVALPAVLRRCAVSGAEFSGGTLDIRFVPDPEVWPQ